MRDVMEKKCRDYLQKTQIFFIEKTPCNHDCNLV